MAGFWQNGYKDRVTVLKAEEELVVQPLQEALRLEGDRSKRQELKRRIKEVRAEFRRKRRDLLLNLYAGS